MKNGHTENALYTLINNSDTIWEAADIWGESVNEFLKTIKQYPQLWEEVKKELSGYFEPKYNYLKYRVNFEILDIWESPDMDDEKWKDYKVNILIPNLDKLTKEERESLISAIYFDCYDLSVNIFFNNKSYNNRDNTITIQEYNGKKISDAEANVILNKNDFINNETIIELMNKTKIVEEVKRKKISKKLNEDYNIGDFDIDSINDMLSKIDFGEYISDVKFDEVALSDTNYPMFHFSFVVDYTNIRKKLDYNDIFPNLIKETCETINDTIQFLNNPHDHKTFYTISFYVFLDTRESKKIPIIKHYFLD